MATATGMNSVADRVIRDELWQSTRWLDLPTDTHRLVFISLLPVSDDFGNLEGGPRRLYRWMVGFTQIKSEADSIKLMSDLQDSDLARRYEVEGREFWHIPRFKSHRQYLVAKVPSSPWDATTGLLGKQQRVIKRGLAKNVPDTSLLHGSDVAQGVGVGVGEKHLRALSSAGFEKFYAAYPKKKSRGRAEKAWRKLNPSEQLQGEILQALERAKTSADWRQESGRFIPHPATWLNDRAWMDESPAQRERGVVF